VRARSSVIRKKRAVRRIAIAVSLLCALALVIGLAEPVPRALATAADAPTLLPADQIPDDGTDRVLVLMPALGTTDLAQGSRLVDRAPEVSWPADHGVVSDLARAPPRQPVIRVDESFGVVDSHFGTLLS
jgi:hypothetical protein